MARERENARADGPGLAQLTFSRRAVLRAGAVGAAALAAGAAVPGIEAEADVTQDEPLAAGGYTINQDWLFGGVYTQGAEQPGPSEAGYQAISLPHTVVGLSWSNWQPSTWENVWIYRKHLSAAALSGGRAFVDFGAAMTNATVYLNGTALTVAGTQSALHQGGYLPFTVELTDHIVAGDNLLAVVVDGTYANVPPNNPAGVDKIDYLEPAGIYRDAALRIVPEVFVSDVFARPRPSTVLSGSPVLDALVTLDAAAVPGGPVSVTAAVFDAGGTLISEASQQPTISHAGQTQLTVSVSGLSGVSLWSPSSPALYQVVVSVTAPGGAVHAYRVRTGFRTAEFRTDGFYLNGSRLQIFGLNRHQHFPYLGAAAPQRVQRRDAQLLKQLNCNMVRCSHYPQSDWFLDACDELGVMVWQEPPGWGYVGQDANWQAVVRQNVTDMIVRDRSRPSVIVWATRLNETTTVNPPNAAANEALYQQTDALATQLDGTRQTTGAMNDYSVTGWDQDVFAYDDYTNVNNTDAALRPPIQKNSAAIPYFVSESVGALDGAPLYRFLDSSATLTLQAKLHAQVHSQAGAAGYAGLLGWAGIDYATLNGASVSAPQVASPDDGSGRVWRNLKTCGVLDPFRVPKPAATFYAAQQNGGAPFVAPAFFWDAASLPQTAAIVFTNCAAVRVTVAGGAPVVAAPDAGDYPHLATPPAFVNLPQINGAPELLLEGLNSAGQAIASTRMSSDTSADQLRLTVDDAAIAADGSDATRFTIQVLDRYGNQRHGATGVASIGLSGPATLLSEPTFDFGAFGGVAGGFIRSQDGRPGTATVAVSHPTLGNRSAQVTLGSPPPPVASSGGSPPAPTPAPAPKAKPPTDAAVRSDLRRMLAVKGAAAHFARVLRRGYTVTFRAPSAGTLHIGWYEVVPVHPVAGHSADAPEDDAAARHPKHRPRTRKLLVATATAHVRRAGRARVHVHLTARGKTLLRTLEHGHAHRQALLAEASFTSRGRRKLTVTRHITLSR